MLRIFLAILLLLGGIETASAQDAMAIRRTLLFEQLQRTQRIGKSACLVLSGADSQLHSDATIDTAVAFSATMRIILDGDAALGLVATPVGALRTSLIEVEQYSRGLTLSAQQVAAGDVHAVPVGLILSRTIPTASKLYAVLLEMQQPSAVQTVSVKNAIQLLHHQNALLEEILKDLCHLRLSIGASASAVHIEENMAAFVAANAALLTGDASQGLDKAPNIRIKITLGQIESKWVSFEALLNGALAGSELGLRDAQLASVIGGTISKRLTKLVGMYEAL